MGEIRIVSPGVQGKIINEYGEPESPPKEWIFLPAGDAGVTRKVSSKGSYWRVQIKKGRRTISKGIWAPKTTIEWAKNEITSMRSSPDYERKQVAAKRLREKKQTAYEIEFCESIENYLHFHADYKILEKLLAKAVTKHAIPIGSGTVARTSMIPIEERAARAVIAWMRHQTTAYDHLNIPKIKGERRAVRRMLAAHSVGLLTNYRNGKTAALNCPLKKALSN